METDGVAGNRAPGKSGEHDAIGITAKPLAERGNGSFQEGDGGVRPAFRAIPPPGDRDGFPGLVEGGAPAREA